jgi:hypothetical protein
MDSNFKSSNFLMAFMYKEAKYALDFLFLFMLVLGITLFSIGFFVDVHGTVLAALHNLDMAILTGYYGFFFHGMYNAKDRTKYCKEHWVMMALLALPLVPIARLVKLAELDRAASVSLNTLWHFFDELELL